MNKPSIGRIVHVLQRGKWYPALICAVHSDLCINAFVFADDREAPEKKTSLMLGQDDVKEGDEAARELTWRWPPRT